MPASPPRNPLPIAAARFAALLAALALTACAPVRTPGFEQLNGAPAAEQSVNPGINDPYLREDVDPDAWAQRFEVESREIYAHREDIADALALRPGDRIADVGAGTGFFVPLFARRVGPQGAVYAVDIVPAFIKHIDRRARAAGLEQVKPWLCSEDSVDLPPESVDTVFICDTYHHFEYPRSSLASIHAALSPGGELFVIDFERIPGVSRDWILQHVRAGKETFRAEIEAAGFEFVEEPNIRGLEENYALRFRKPR